MRRETLTLVTKAGPVVIDIEATETLDEMQRGLMFRTHLAEKAGMLFTYDQPREVGIERLRFRMRQDDQGIHGASPRADG